MRIVYTKGTDPAETQVYFEADGQFPDLTGFTFEVVVFKQLTPASPEFTKTNGLVGANPFPEGDADADDAPGFTGTPDVDKPAPNLIVTWATELAPLAPGLYLIHYKAEGTNVSYETYDELLVRAAVANRGYCDEPDLLFDSNVELPGDFDAYSWINAAADDINGAIGQVYDIPINLSAAAGFVAPLLRSINAKLASGRYLCTTSAADDARVHAYGAQLIKEAQAAITKIASNDMQLIGVAKLPGSFRVTAPSVTNADKFSAVDVFEDFAYGWGWMDTWRPGPHDNLRPTK